MSDSKPISTLSDPTATDVSSGQTVSSTTENANNALFETAIANLNDAVADMESHRAGTSAPTDNTTEGQIWCDTTNNPAVLKFDPDGAGADIQILTQTEDGAVWPSFSAYLGSNQVISTASATKIQFDTEHFDTNSDFDNVTNYRFTPTVAGKYLLAFAVKLQSALDETFGCNLYKNGVAYFIGDMSPRETSTPTTRHFAMSLVVDANGSSDYFEIYVDSATDTSYTATVNGTIFTGSRIA